MVWADTTEGRLEFFLRSQGAQAMDSQLFTISQLSVYLSPNPFAATALFNLTHDPATSSVTISAGPAFSATAFVDALSDSLFVSGVSSTPVTINATLSSVRPATRLSYKLPFSCINSSSGADQFDGPLPSAPDSLVMWRRNDVAAGDIDAVAWTLNQQGLGSLVPLVGNPWQGRQSGVEVDGVAGGVPLARLTPATLSSAAPAQSFEVRVSFLVANTDSPAQWRAALAQQVAARPASASSAWGPHAAWWEAFWARSFVTVNGTDTDGAEGDAARRVPAHLSGRSLSPAPPAGASLWLRADDLSQPGPVAHWPDASGTGAGASQPNATAQPVFDPAAFPGARPAVVFSGSGHFLSGSVSLPSSGYTVLAVIRDTSTVTSCCSGVFFARPSFTGLSTRAIPMGSADGDDDNGGGSSGPNATVVTIDWPGSADGIGTQDIDDRAVVAAVRYSPSGAASFIDGCPESTTAAQDTSSSSFMVGARNNELGRYFGGAIAELLVFPRPLNDTEMAEANDYLVGRWNLPAFKCKRASGAGKAITAQYVRHRYLQAVQSRGGHATPIKFNGMNFLAQRGNNGPVDADYRQWGANNWWQNTRLPYGNMLAAGDVEQLDVLLDYYMSFLPFAQARTMAYFNHTGIFFTETKTLFGAFQQGDYGCAGERPDGWPVWLENSGWMQYDYHGNAGGPEVAMLALDRYAYTGDAAGLTRHFPLVAGSLDFSTQHYPNRTQRPDGSTQAVFWPTQALETYWCPWPATAENCVTDDAPTVAATTALLSRTLSLPSSLLSSLATSEQLARWRAFQALLPPLPMAADGTLAPAAFHQAQRHNIETPELYAVHPYRLLTAARAVTAGVNITPAIASWRSDEYANGYNQGWNQGIMCAALLGMADEAMGQVVQRAMDAPAAGYRYPAFMPADYDFAPSADHLSNLLSAVNWMLLQPADDAEGTMLALPAWPCNTDVSFQLWGPMNTSVAVTFSNGTLTACTVAPAARVAALRWGSCVPQSVGDAVCAQGGA